MTDTSLENRSAAFATSIQNTLDGSLPGGRLVVSLKSPAGNKFVVKLAEEKMPLLVDGKVVGYLGFSMDQQLDRSGQFLKTTGSKITVSSKIDKTPLVRLEYDAGMRSAPIAHWQVHAERGAMSFLLGRAHLRDASRVAKPHDFSSLHFPLGGERFRPCMEDVIQFLIQDCGIDSLPGWRDVIERGRESWRRMQLRSAVRDAPEDAANVLRDLGYVVEHPDGPADDRCLPLRKW